MGSEMLLQTVLYNTEHVVVQDLGVQSILMNSQG